MNAAASEMIRTEKLLNRFMGRAIEIYGFPDFDPENTGKSNHHTNKNSFYRNSTHSKQFADHGNKMYNEYKSDRYDDDPGSQVVLVTKRSVNGKNG